MRKRKNNTRFIVLILVLLLINVIAAVYFLRFDLTKDHRYTLSESAKKIITNVDSPVTVTVFLKGNFPSAFKRLQNETRYLLEEFNSYNRQLKFRFTNPLEKGEPANKVANRFYKSGMSPENLNVYENGKTSESLLFPWAVANYNGKQVKIHLLKKKLGDSNEQIVNNSIQNLEYAFADGFKKLTTKKTKKIAIMRGNGELPDENIADFITALKPYYYVAPFTLDSVAKNPQKTLRELNQYDLVLEPKPIRSFTEKQKYVLDQYLMQGGKELWLVDQVTAEKDSLFTHPDNTSFALPKSLNLRDFFFKYGLRINPTLVKDLYAAPIILASGQGNNTQFNPYPWYYDPLAISKSKNPIVNNIEAVRFNFTSPIDTLKNSLKKTILLQTSSKTKIEGTPEEISLDHLREKPDASQYRAGPQNLAVLLEGKFNSVYKNRLKPFPLSTPLDASIATKMIVISDGDVIKNEIKKGKPLGLGEDRYTGNTYGNKAFLLNSVHYLLDDSGLLNLRARQLKIAFLNTDKVEQERLRWQLINLLLPLLILGGFGALFTFFKRKKYQKNKNL